MEATIDIFGLGGTQQDLERQHIGLAHDEDCAPHMTQHCVICGACLTAHNPPRYHWNSNSLRCKTCS